MLIALALLAQTKEVDTRQIAADFLASLTAEQSDSILKTFQDPYRTFWRFVPASREGVQLGSLTPEQKSKAESLLKATLSDAGYRKVLTIQSLESVLYELEGQNQTRNADFYTYTFFGQPSSTLNWGWRFEGHHVSLNFTYQGNKLISSSPQFLGSNPAVVQSGPKKETAALAQEQTMAFQFLNTLSEEQKAKAIINNNAPSDIVTGNDRKASIQAKSGIPFADLTIDQKVLLLKILHLYADVPNAAEAKRRWSRVDEPTLVFAWMGSPTPGKGHYYRIQGSKFVVEYDNTQNNANHIHTVWRDFENDFGQDLLEEHYHNSPHPHSHP